MGQVLYCRNAFWIQSQKTIIDTNILLQTLYNTDNRFLHKIRKNYYLPCTTKNTIFLHLENEFDKLLREVLEL